MNKEQTPIEWLVNQLEKYNRLTETEFKVIIKQAKQMDKKRMDELKDFDVWKEWKNKPENKKMNKETKFKIGDKAHKPKGYKFPCTIVGVFETINGDIRVVGEMDEYGLLHIFNEEQLEHYEEK